MSDGRRIFLAFSEVYRDCGTVRSRVAESTISSAHEEQSVLSPRPALLCYQSTKTRAFPGQHRRVSVDQSAQPATRMPLGPVALHLGGLEVSAKMNSILVECCSQAQAKLPARALL